MPTTLLLDLAGWEIGAIAGTDGIGGPDPVAMIEAAERGAPAGG